MPILQLCVFGFFRAASEHSYVRVRLHKHFSNCDNNQDDNDDNLGHLILNYI